MNSATPLAKFDFTKPSGLAGERFEQLNKWLGAFCTVFGEKWNSTCGQEAAFRIGSCDVYTFENIRRRIPRTHLGYYLNIGPHAIPSLLFLSQSLSLAFVYQLLGEALEDMPPEQPMTEVEASLFEVFISCLIDSLSEAWPDKEPLSCTIGEPEPEPHRSRILGPREIVTVCKLAISLADSEQELEWLLPHEQLESLLTTTEEPLPHANARAHAPATGEMEMLAARIPVNLAIGLGHCKLPVACLASLEVGDTLVLDQPIDEPLPAHVGDRIKFAGWLGRDHNQRAFKICRLIQHGASE